MEWTEPLPSSARGSHHSLDKSFQDALQVSVTERLGEGWALWHSGLTHHLECLHPISDCLLHLLSALHLGSNLGLTCLEATAVILQMTVTVGIGSGRGREPGTSSTSPTWVPGAHLSLLSSQEAESPGGQPGSDLALCSEMAAFVGSGLVHCAPMLPPYIHSHLLQGELVGTG